MIVILLGAPGAGKGTQAIKIAQKYNIPHISTGDIFRKNIKEKTPIGIKAKEYIDKGQLVPDEVTVEIVRQRLKESDCKNGFLLDGFPRNLFQAEELAKIVKIDAVINIDIDLEKLTNRLTGRRVCECGASFHVDMLGDKDTCDICAKPLYQRDDDKEETVKKRLDVYSSQTKPLIEFYRQNNLLHNAVGDGKIDEVFERVLQILEQIKK